MPVYAYPNLGRTGLGNMLFPWARAEVFAARHNIPILAPRWTAPKIRPLLRGEKDPRYYMGLFDNSGYIRGLRRAAILAWATRIPQSDAESFITSAESGNGASIIEFAGWQGWFNGVLSHRELIVRRLSAILSPRVRRRLAAADSNYDIAVHIRRGDKTPLPFGQPLSGDSTETLADQWYLNAIRSVKAVMGPTARVRIFTDAKPGQIEPVLAEPGITRSDDNPSIVDIFLLSRAQVLITTGGSSFSAWASFLGAMPTIWYPTSGIPLIENQSELSIETDLEGRISDAGKKVIAAVSR